MIAMLFVLLSMPAYAQSAAPDCRPSGELMRLDGLPEASGMAVSRAMPGMLWLHNDSGRPELIAVDAKGKPAGRVSLAGATVEDWEALSSGPCDDGHCLYVGDIGDNDAARSHVTIYRLREPSKAAGSAKVDGVFRAAYPDGAHDAEALLVAPDGTLHIVTKGETGSAALYRVPREPRAGATMRLERIGEPMSKGPLAQAARITDGAVSPDGRWVALRTRTSVTLYPAADFFKGTFTPARTIDLKSLGEPQGEAIAFSSAGTLLLGGEGGGGTRAGTLGVLTCGG